MSRSMLGLWAVSLIIAVGVGAIAGRVTAVTMHQAVPMSAPEAISIEADGWTYGVPTDVAWVDNDGSFHDHGRPDCLPAEGTTQSVRFASVDVNLDGAGWRAVVWVSCR
jgi:hypothetical protein